MKLEWWMGVFLVLLALGFVFANRGYDNVAGPCFGGAVLFLVVVAVVKRMKRKR